MDILKNRFLGIPNTISGLRKMACNLCGYTLVNLFHVPAIVRHFVGANLCVRPYNGFVEYLQDILVHGFLTAQVERGRVCLNGMNI